MDIFLTISWLVIIQYQKMAEKIKINLTNGKKKLFRGQGPLKIGKVVRLYNFSNLFVWLSVCFDRYFRVSTYGVPATGLKGGTGRK
jgi:hypothetical protein